MRPLFLIAAFPLALVACNQAPTETADTETALPVEPDGGTADVAPPSSPTASPAPTSPSDASGAPQAGIPAAVQGRWGMVPADCTSTRGDAKGLLQVSATTLTFYESVARLGSIEDRSDSSITADFTFSGEGMTWSREVRLTARDGTLTRVERAAGEPQATYTYTKCTT